MLSDILKWLTDSLNNGNLLVAFLVVVIAFIFHYKKIVDFFEERRRAKISRLLEARNCEYLSELAKERIQEELATEYFKLATGVRLEKNAREILLRTAARCSENVDFVHFKRAIPHMRFSGKRLKVEISKYAVVGHWFNLIFGLFLVIVGLGFVGFIPYLVSGSKQFLVFFVEAAFFIFFGMFMISESFSVFSARLIQKALKNDKCQELSDWVDA